ncbi:MAG: baseplate J/gp47 family protein [Chloroflexi bacterium]|nr:baseplate J/gp47 family protein [Chloroflexota bacterium]
MKTTILRLDAHDDIVSMRDKMNWAKSGRILLIWPENGRVLNRRIDLALLQRQAASLGAQLALVARDPQVSYYAAELAIPVFPDLRKAQKSLWRVRRRQKLKPGLPARPRPELETLQAGRRRAAPGGLHPALRWVAFGLAALAALALAAAVFPAAEVRLSPQRQIQELTLAVRPDPALTAVNHSGALPALPVRAQVSGESSLAATGQIAIPDQFAAGEALFTNLTGSPQFIPAGLAVLGGDEAGQRYLTTQGGELPAGAGASLTLPVRAALPGASGNLAAGKLYAIEGSLGASVTATNPASLRNGSDQLAAAPSAQDRQRLLADLEANLYRNALALLRQQAPPGSLFYSRTLTVTRVVEQSFLPAADAPGSQLSLSLRLEFQALHTPQTYLLDLGKRLLDANLPQGYVPLSGEIEIEAVPASTAEEAWRLRFRRTLIARVRPDQAAALLLGKPPAQGPALLSASLPLGSPPVIVLNPAWWPRLPLLPSRIKVFTP